MHTTTDTIELCLYEYLRILCLVVLMLNPDSRFIEFERPSSFTFEAQISNIVTLYFMIYFVFAIISNKFQVIELH